MYTDDVCYLGDRRKGVLTRAMYFRRWTRV